MFNVIKISIYKEKVILKCYAPNNITHMCSTEVKRRNRKICNHVRRLSVPDTAGTSKQSKWIKNIKAAITNWPYWHTKDVLLNEARIYILSKCMWNFAPKLTICQVIKQVFNNVKELKLHRACSLTIGQYIGLLLRESNWNQIRLKSIWLESTQ